jgi:hypothetical protein
VRAWDVAMCGLGLVVVTGRAVRDAFDALASRGRAGGTGQGSPAASMRSLVTEDVPAGVGRLLGATVDLAARTAEQARACAEATVERGLHLAGLPSPDEIRQLRAQVDALTARLEALAAPAAAPPGTASSAPAGEAAMETAFPGSGAGAAPGDEPAPG